MTKEQAESIVDGLELYLKAKADCDKACYEGASCQKHDGNCGFCDYSIEKFDRYDKIVGILQGLLK